MNIENIENLRERHKTEQKEADEKGGVPISNIEDIVKEGFAEKKKPLDPSSESSQFIEEEGRAFSDKQIEIAKISAFFLEKCAEAANFILRSQREKSFNDEDAKELDVLLSELDKKYEDILQKPKEYESALQVISELRENIPGFIEKNSSAISALLDIAKRIDAFNHSLLGKEGKSEYNIQASHNFLNKIFSLIIGRIPSEALRQPPMFDMLAGEKGKENLDEVINMSLPLPPLKILEFESRIKERVSESKNLTQMKERSLTSGLSFAGGEIEALPSRMLSISLSGEKLNIEIYLRDGKASIHCTLKDMANKTKIKKEIQGIPKENWLSLIEDVIKDI